MLKIYSLRNEMIFFVTFPRNLQWFTNYVHVIIKLYEMTPLNKLPFSFHIKMLFIRSLVTFVDEIITFSLRWHIWWSGPRTLQVIVTEYWCDVMNCTYFEFFLVFPLFDEFYKSGIRVCEISRFPRWHYATYKQTPSG